MQPSTAEQVRGLAFLDAEARKQSRMFLVFGVVLVPLSVAFPVASLFTGIPWWVGGIMFVCAGLLGGVCILLGLTRGSEVLAHLRAQSTDPVVRARIWVEVNRGARSVHCACVTGAGVELHEVLFVSGADEERAIAAFRSVVPTVDVG